MTTCAVCGQWLPGPAAEYGDRERPCCLSDWLVYLAWQERVDIVANEVFGRFIKASEDSGEYGRMATMEIAAQVLGLTEYATFAEPDDVEADVLEQYGLLPAHVRAVGHGPKPVAPLPVGRLL